jgi:hypothetical protein
MATQEYIPPSGRMIYIIGEYHEYRDISSHKVSLLPAIGENAPFFIFTETETNSIFESAGQEGSLEKQQNVEELPSNLEKLLFVLDFIRDYKIKYKKPICIDLWRCSKKSLPQTNEPKLTPTDMFMRILTVGLSFFRLPGETVKKCGLRIRWMLFYNTKGLFNFCIEKLREFTNILRQPRYEKDIRRDALIIQKLMLGNNFLGDKYTYNNIDKSPNFEKDWETAIQISIRLVDRFIVRMVLAKHLDPLTPDNMYFVVVVGNNHVKNIKAMLLSARQNFIVIARDDDTVPREGVDYTMERSDSIDERPIEHKDYGKTIKHKDFDYSIDGGKKGKTKRIKIKRKKTKRKMIKI